MVGILYLWICGLFWFMLGTNLYQLLQVNASFTYVSDPMDMDCYERLKNMDSYNTRTPMMSKDSTQEFKMRVTTYVKALNSGIFQTWELCKDT